MSHTYKNLSKTTTVTEASKNYAQQMPLVHSIRSHAGRARVIDLLMKGRLGNVLSRESTRRASDGLGIPQGAMFFYAGRAFPEEGIQIVMLYGGVFDADKNKEEQLEFRIQSNCSDLMDCGARPFDAGGLVSKEPEKRLKFDVSKWVQVRNDVSKAKIYFDDHNVTKMNEWRPYFSLFLTEFFESPKDYLDGVPKKEIDGVAFDANDSWRNWTFELHSKWKVPLNLAGDIIVDARLEYHFLNQPGFGGVPAMAPAVKRIGRFHHAPREEAERRVKHLLYSDNGRQGNRK